MGVIYFHLPKHGVLVVMAVLFPLACTARAVSLVGLINPVLMDIQMSVKTP